MNLCMRAHVHLKGDDQLTLNYFSNMTYLPLAVQCKIESRSKVDLKTGYQCLNISLSPNYRNMYFV